MTSVGRGTGVGGLEHTFPEAPKAARVGADRGGSPCQDSSLLNPGQLNAVTCWEGGGWGLESAACSWGWLLAFPTFPSLAGPGQQAGGGDRGS